MRLFFCKTLELYLTYCNYLKIIERHPISPKGGGHSFVQKPVKKESFIFLQEINFKLYRFSVYSFSKRM